MQDQPDVAHGTLQASGHIVTDFRLNAAFVAAVGEPKAQRTIEVLTHVAAECEGRDRRMIQSRLRTQLQAIGVHLSEVELDSFADQLSRSERTMQVGEANPHERLVYPAADAPATVTPRRPRPGRDHRKRRPAEPAES